MQLVAKNKEIPKSHLLDPQFKTDVLQIVREYMKSAAFTDRKLTDMPTDALSVVNRKFVTANGLTAARPPAPVTGQSFFDTTLGQPIWWDGANWVDATGTPA